MFSPRRVLPSWTAESRSAAAERINSKSAGDCQSAQGGLPYYCIRGGVVENRRDVRVSKGNRFTALLTIVQVQGGLRDL